MAKNPKNDTVEYTLSILAADATGKSQAVDLGPNRLWAVQMPAAWTAAALTFLASSEGVTYAPVYIEGAEYSITVGASQFVVIGSNLIGAQFVQLRSGTASTPVQQGADRTMKLICLARL